MALMALVGVTFTHHLALAPFEVLFYATPSLSKQGRLCFSVVSKWMQYMCTQTTHVIIYKRLYIV
jgi:hypothetical protein